MKEKDIYEFLNKIDVDIPNEEIPLDEIQIKRIKKNVKKKIYSDKRKYIIAALIFLSFIFITSPFGKDVIAKIKEKLVFNPASGIISLEDDKEIYMLKNPFTVRINNKDMLIKGISNNGEVLFIQIIGDVYPVEAKEIASNIAVKLKSGEIKDSNGYGIDTSGGKSVIELGIDIKGMELKDLTLMYKDNVLKEISLEKPDYKNNYDEIGGNSTNKGILIGGSSYYIQGERYFRLWSDESKLSSKDYDVGIGNIEINEVRDENGNLLAFEPSNEGTGREYKILDDYSGKINIKVEEVELDYNLKTSTKLKFKDPEKSGNYKLGKKLSFDGIEDIINITEIKKGEKDIIINFDFSNNISNDRFIYYISDYSRATSGMSDKENMIGEINIDYKDLSIFEKLTGNIKVNIDKLDVIQKGKWEFTIE